MILRWSFYNVTALMLSAYFAIGVSTPLRADDQNCQPGEFVLSISNNRALRVKALDSVEEATLSDFEIRDQATFGVLLQSDEVSAQNIHTTSSKIETVDACHALRIRDRKLKLKNRINARSIPIRRYNCSCNSVITVDARTNDPALQYQWGADNTNDVDMDLPEAWDYVRGSDSIVVGIIDTGIDYNHPDLVDNVWTNPYEIPGNGVDDDADGYVDDVHGINTINNSGDPMDDHYHGTHVAGTIGARGNNGIGVSGVTQNVKMIGIKFLDNNGSGALFNAMKAIDYATYLKLHGVNILLTNNSWGGGGYSAPLMDAIVRAKNAGLLFVAAAGNDGKNNDASPSYPAGYPVDNVISVAALDTNGALASFSNYGASSVHLAAPGSGIASTAPGNRYIYLSGTSMATPHVSGALALLKTYSNNLPWDQLKAKLLSSGDSYPSLAGKTITGKMVNMFKLIQAAPYDPAPGGDNPTPAPGSPIGTQPTPTPVSGAPTPAPTATPTPAPTPSTYTIAGTVTLNGKGIQTARVVLRTSNATTIQYSGPNGEFDFGAQQAGTLYTITASKTGFTVPPINTRLTGNAVHSLYATPGAYTLSALVIDDNRTPLSGVTIDAGTAAGTCITDSIGRCSFSVPYNFSYTMLATSLTYALDENIRSGKVIGNVTRVFVGRPK